VNLHQDRCIAIFAVLPVTMAQNFRIRIDLEAAFFGTWKVKSPPQERGGNGHRVPVLKQRVRPKWFVFCRAHLSNLGEPGRQNKFTAMPRSALQLTFLGQKTSISL
jgi:hypothetical protein